MRKRKLSLYMNHYTFRGTKSIIECKRMGTRFKKQHEVVFRLDEKRKTTKQSCCGESSYKKGKGFHKEKTLHKIRQRHRGKISKEREKCLSKKRQKQRKLTTGVN